MKFTGKMIGKGKIYKGELSKDMKQELERVMETACILVEGTAKSLCPVDKGRLRGSITHKVKK